MSDDMSGLDRYGAHNGDFVRVWGLSCGVRIDVDGIVWFTIAASNEVGRFDPKTERMTVIPLPHDGFWRGVTDYAFPYVVKVASFFPQSGMHLALSHTKWADQGRDALSLPYGIDVNPVAGSIWYAKLNVNKIGRIMKGPRRPRFDKDGNLWIPVGSLSRCAAARSAACRPFGRMSLPREAAALGIADSGQHKEGRKIPN